MGSLFILLKELICDFYLPSLQLMLCSMAAVKTSPRTSTIMQFIFHFCSFEISVNIMRNQKWMIGLVSYSRQIFGFLGPILVYVGVWIVSLFEVRGVAVSFL